MTDEEDRIIEVWKRERAKERAQLCEKAFGWVFVGFLALVPIAGFVALAAVPASVMSHEVVVTVCLVTWGVFLIASLYLHWLKERLRRRT